MLKIYYLFIYNTKELKTDFEHLSVTYQFKSL